MKFIFILTLVAAPLANAFCAELQGSSGKVIYSRKTPNGFQSLTYKNRNGKELHPFDEGLNFNYEGSSLSQDKSYSSIQFSETGTLSSDDSTGIDQTLYLCAFMRMSDGCVVAVEQGEQCGGHWIAPNSWSSMTGNGNRLLFNTPPSISKTLTSYASRKKDSSQISTPKILSHLIEGTSFENLLTCDPPKKSNSEKYISLLRLLNNDSDLENAKQLKQALDSTDAPPQDKREYTIIKKDFLYKSPSEEGVTRSYLIPGDKVTSTQDTNSQFIKIKYRKESGKIIEAWVKSSNLDE